MDIFSAGCVIAEILCDGIPLFDLPRLQKYRRDELDLQDDLLKRIEDNEIVNLLLEMMNRDPKARPTAQQCLISWCEKIFPHTFGNTFFHLGAAMQRLCSLYSDNRIALMRYHINTIFKNCFNIDDAVVT